MDNITAESYYCSVVQLCQNGHHYILQDQGNSLYGVREFQFPVLNSPVQFYTLPAPLPTSLSGMLTLGIPTITFPLSGAIVCLTARL